MINKTIFIAILLVMNISFAADIIVTDTKILGHGDPVPRFSKVLTGNHLIVPAGQTVTLAADSTYDAIEVAGTLKVSRIADTVCRFTHFTILPGGTFDQGTAADPVLKRNEFIIRDVPIDMTLDPFQFGNGIINFGTWRTYGVNKDRTWSTMQEVDAGATQLRFTVPAGWKVGDELLLPDTRQQKPGVAVRREKVTISAINNNGVVSLSTPTTFEHLAAHSPDGDVRFLPYAVNISRNIVFRSENPNGKRGHTINLEEASVDVRYAAFLGLGRTLPINLDNTTPDPNSPGHFLKIGTNQVARYSWHWHHVHCDCGGHANNLVGCYLYGDLIAKWGVVVHATHDTYVADNISDSFIGSGFITEDGYEVRNVFERNLAINIPGNGKGGKENLDPPSNIPGGEGAGFWFHGMQNTFRDNVTCNSNIGFQFFYLNQVTGQKVPNVPGGEADTLMDPTTAIPIENTRNVGFACNTGGLEVWNSPTAFAATDLYTWHSRDQQVNMGNGQPANITIKGFHALSQSGAAAGLHSNAAYSVKVDVDGGEVEGCSTAFFDAGEVVSLKNLRIVIPADGIGYNTDSVHARQTTIENVKFEQAGPKKYIVYGAGQNWIPGTPLPNYGAWSDLNTGHRFIVKSWQQVPGDDYLLFENQSRRSKPAWYGVFAGVAGQTNSPFISPEVGLTMGQCWDKYGFAYGGGVIDDTDAVTLDGLINAVGKKGLGVVLPSARAILVDPVASRPTLYNGGPVTNRLDFRVYLTGQTDGAILRGALLSLDGKPPLVVGPWYSDMDGVYRAVEGIEPGTHKVDLWRVDIAGVAIAGSKTSFSYVVGDSGTPPPPPNPNQAEIDLLTARLVEIAAQQSALAAEAATDQARLAVIKP